jgi:hypothetical protein
MLFNNQNERNQLLTTSSELILKWKDAALTWDPKNYADLAEIRMNAGDIWVPDVMLLNRYKKPSIKFGSKIEHP